MKQKRRQDAVITVHKNEIFMNSFMGNYMNSIQYQWIDACENGHIDIVKYLVEQGADIHAESDKALVLASQFNHFEVVKYLVENGADKNNDEALRLARRNGHLRIIEYLNPNIYRTWY